MVRVWLALCACAVLLTGCVHATKANFPRHYTLNAAAPALTGEHATANANGKILQITNITVPDWLDGTAMYYRLDYERDGRLAAYANSDWIATPAALLEPLLQQTILAGGGWRAVIGPRSPASADATLQIGLDDFSQHFSQPNESTGVLDATATLVSNRDEHVIAQQHFHIGIPAPTPDAQGGAKALGDASAEFADALRRWADSAATRANAGKGR
jgi:cholesterol transport system auxiliary component